MREVKNLIIGAGPGGLQLGHHFDQQGEPYLIVDRADKVGSFFERFPRHRALLSINKRYTGYPDLASRRRYDWNSLLCEDDALQFPRYSDAYFPDAGDLVRYLNDFADHYKLNLQLQSEVLHVALAHTGFDAELVGGARIRCERLFVATGLSRERLPAIPGLELCDSYADLSVEPEDYTDQRVFIVGKGNSAFETASSLVERTRKLWVCGPEPVRLAWTSHYVGDLRAVNNNYLDTYQLKAQNNVLDGEVRAVRRDARSGELEVEVYFESRRRSYRWRCDRVLLCTGFEFADEIYAPSCKPRRRECGRLPAMNSQWESTNVPNMFFVGTLMQSRDHRKTMSGFIHGFRHNIEALTHILAHRDGRVAVAGASPVDASARPLARLLIERMSTSPELLLQPGFLADAVLLGDREAPDTLRYVRGMPVDYLMEHVVPAHGAALVMTLEYKETDGHMDVFNMPRGVDVAEDFYIHPIIKRFEDGELVDRLFLPDDLDNDWRADPEYRHRVESWLRAPRSALADVVNTPSGRAPLAADLVEPLAGHIVRGTKVGA